ncbi:BTB/POZ domain-containing protein 17 [Lates japonicus]|uniref:BTB/POZ domain-containing protein 17 n=1 Tax=Lates japonicus TaxID=270547 RepID=A0AAD3N1M4_LATJO|nr:BTB/POZ domain-containing protein 17 [Lates japonicus]
MVKPRSPPRLGGLEAVSAGRDVHSETAAQYLAQTHWVLEVTISSQLLMSLLQPLSDLVLQSEMELFAALEAGLFRMNQMTQSQSRRYQESVRPARICPTVSFILTGAYAKHDVCSSVACLETTCPQCGVASDHQQPTRDDRSTSSDPAGGLRPQATWVSFCSHLGCLSMRPRTSETGAMQPTRVEGGHQDHHHPATPSLILPRTGRRCL